MEADQVCAVATKITLRLAFDKPACFQTRSDVRYSRGGCEVGKDQPRAHAATLEQLHCDMNEPSFSPATTARYVPC
jgi:hypothetical protein